MLPTAAEPAAFAKAVFAAPDRQHLGISVAVRTSRAKPIGGKELAA
jgi:hypothetical protein